MVELYVLLSLSESPPVSFLSSLRRVKTGGFKAHRGRFRVFRHFRSYEYLGILFKVF